MSSAYKLENRETEKDKTYVSKCCLIMLYPTFEPAGSSFPVDCALVQQPSPALCQVLSAKHSAIFDFSLCLWLHFVVYIS